MPVERTPVWMMRQAGRYLPEYRAIRAKTDFLTLCKTPDLAAEVTIQPVDLVGVDAAILFSDILVIPEAMGMELIIEEGKGGPRFPDPIRTASAIEHLRRPDPNDHLGYVMQAIRTTKRGLNDRVPLIGFSGSPWTLATYMVEGSGSKNFRHIKNLVYSNPEAAHLLLEKLAVAVADYLSAQIEAGVDAVQIFDTWGGILPPDEFREFSLLYIEKVIGRMIRSGQPIIVFCKDCDHSSRKIAGSGADAIGVDWTTDLAVVRNRVGEKVAIQGNLDPVLLFSEPSRIEQGVRDVLEKYGQGPGHIFNLGHGILPETPVENAKAMIEAVKRLSPAYHTKAAYEAI